MKKHAAIVIAVAAVIVVVALVWDRRDLSPASPDIERATTDLRDPPVAVRTRQSRVASEAPAPDASPSTANEAAPPKITGTPLPNLDKPCECEADLYERLEERAEAIRQAEPKDTAWAYDTEQLLAQYLATDPNAKVFSISAVDCRTSFCEIRAIGTPQEQRAFAEVIIAMFAEPWSTLGGLDIAFRVTEDGQKELSAFIQRSSEPRRADTGGAHAAACNGWACLPVEDCECASAEWHAQKEAHEAAKREAEPRDPDWAYATEQGIAQLFAVEAPQLQDFSVDCRTTYCELRVILPTDESEEVLHAAISKVLSQHRFGFTPGAEGDIDNTDGRTTVTMRMQRRPETETGQ